VLAVLNYPSGASDAAEQLKNDTGQKRLYEQGFYAGDADDADDADLTANADGRHTLPAQAIRQAQTERGT
jgi:hypothetical protein